MCGRRDRLLGEGERDWEMGEVQQGAVVILLSIGKWYNDVQDALTFLSADQLSFHQFANPTTVQSLHAVRGRAIVVK